MNKVNFWYKTQMVLFATDLRKCDEVLIMSYGSKFYKRSNDYKPLYKSLVSKAGKENAKKMFALVGEELDNIMKSFPDVPAGERNHTDNYIFRELHYIGFCTRNLAKMQ